MQALLSVTLVNSVEGVLQTLHKEIGWPTLETLQR